MQVTDAQLSQLTPELAKLGLLVFFSREGLFSFTGDQTALIAIERISLYSQQKQRNICFSRWFQLVVQLANYINLHSCWNITLRTVAQKYTLVVFS